MWAPDRHDDEIYEHALREFPEFAMAPHASLIVLDEEWMKSKEGKERRRGFINACVYLSLKAAVWTPVALLTPKSNQRRRYEKTTDYNFGSLIRRRDEGVQRDEYDLGFVFDIAPIFVCMLMMYLICNYANTGKILSIIRSRPGDGESYT